MPIVNVVDVAVAAAMRPVWSHVVVVVVVVVVDDAGFMYTQYYLIK